MLTEDIESLPGGLERLAKGLSGVHQYGREVFLCWKARGRIPWTGFERPPTT